MVQPGLGLSFDRVPVTILTGYLGAGKTTLLNRILSEPHGERIAVIVNEFGEVGIDDKLIVRGDDEVIEMANGCMCCVVQDDTRQTLYSMNERRKGRGETPLTFDRVIIEASGVANPVPVLRMLLEDDQLMSGYRVDGVVTLVDAFHISDQYERALEVKEQIACADVLVVNKVDLVDEEKKVGLIKWLGQLNPRARIVSTTKATLPLQSVLEIGGFSAPDGVVFTHDHHSHDPDIQSLVLRASRPLVRSVFEEWLVQHVVLRGNDLYRYKGIVALKGEPLRFVVQGVHAYFDFSPGSIWKEGEALESVLVLIGRDLDIKELEHSFLACQSVGS